MRGLQSSLTQANKLDKRQPGFFSLKERGGTKWRSISADAGLNVGQGITPSHTGF